MQEPQKSRHDAKLPLLFTPLGLRGVTARNRIEEVRKLYPTGEE